MSRNNRALLEAKALQRKARKHGYMLSGHDLARLRNVQGRAIKVAVANATGYNGDNDYGDDSDEGEGEARF
jgi:hypothetical protein